MIKTKTFNNGFRMIHEKPKSQLPISSIYIFCEFGSIHEDNGVRGAAHFIEHMCFKGTQKIPTGKEVAKVYDKIGAYFNAYTEKRYTCYTINCEDEYFDNSIYVVSDLMLHSSFMKTEFEKERNVVVEENVKNEDDPNDTIDMQMNRLLYKGSAMENAIDTLKYHNAHTLKYEDVVELYRTYYTPKNMILSVVSNRSFEHICKAIDKTFFTKKHPAPKITLIYNPHVNIQPSIQYDIKQKKGVTTLYMSIGFRTCAYNSDDKYKVKVLNHIIGVTSSSRLFSILREENGLTYTPKSKCDFYDDLGDLTIQIKTDPTKLLKNGKNPGVLPIIVNILRDLLQNGITQQELKMAKGNLKGSMLLNMNNNNTFTYFNGEQLLMKTPEINSYFDIYNKYYDSITRSDINRTIQKYITPTNMSICIFGGHVPSLETVEKECEKIFKD